MKVLITGANGMVGKNITEALSDKQLELFTPSSSELNLLDEVAVREYIQTNTPDAVIHCAGIVGGIQANIAAPVKFLVENTYMGLNVINESYKVGVPKLLNLASSCMYPRNGENPLKEELVLAGELEPTNEGYALAKITATRLCEYIAKESQGLQYKTLIPCNLYGRHDKFSPKHSHMIPAVIRKIHEAKERGDALVDIWGDGMARREFMYAGDLADFTAFALFNMEKLPQNTNVGLGYDYTINEYYEAVAKVVGFEGEFEHDLIKPVGMKQKLVDNSKIENLGWSAQTTLEQGIGLAYRFYLEEWKDNEL